MAAKKSITKQNLIKAYMKHVLKEGAQPHNVFSFTEENNLKEDEFYKHFSSFASLEQSIFTTFFDETQKLLNKDENYIHFSPKDKLLSFYFTFFAILTKNRSYVVHTLNENKYSLDGLRKLQPLKKLYTNYVVSLGIEVPDMKIPKIESLKERSIQEASYGQLLFTLKFWLNDDSPSFVKTDVFIEKSINTSFEVMNASPIESIIDLGKFLFKENHVFKS